MNNSWGKNSDWSVTSALQTLEELGGQFKRNVDMRMRKGDVRSAVLRLLNESPMHGYQIIQEIEDRSDGVWKPSPGSVYPTLQLLVDEGLLDSKETKGRRTYSLTVAGKEVAEAENETPAPWLTTGERPAGPRGNLAISGMKIAKASAEVARVGSTEQLEKAAQILNDATRAINKILSQD